VAAARAKLHHWCTTIITTEAASSTAAGGEEAAPCSSSSNSSNTDIPLRDALCGTSWEHAVRAPLVVQALQVISGARGEEFRQQVRSCFPSLVRLMCSNHSLIRAALYQVVASSHFQEMLLTAAQQ
jgi:hypothetical protein